MNDIEKTKFFYQNSYLKAGIRAQRRYPNEEFCRFMGRHFLDKDINLDSRRQIKILETGCGSGANLWMVAREGFDAYGIDLSEQAVILANEMLDSYSTKANLSVQNMECLNFPDTYFNAVVDIFSSYCLDKKQGMNYLNEVSRVLKSDGFFFSYFPSKKSDTYQYPGDSNFIDSDTLDAVTRKDSPFCGQDYPFRFMHPREYSEVLTNLGFEIQYLESIDKTYRNQQEIFSFVSIVAKKK